MVGVVFEGLQESQNKLTLFHEPHPSTRRRHHQRPKNSLRTARHPQIPLLDQQMGIPRR